MALKEKTENTHTMVKVVKSQKVLFFIIIFIDQKKNKEKKSLKFKQLINLFKALFQLPNWKEKSNIF